MDTPTLSDTSVTPTTLPDGYNRIRYSPIDFGAAQGEALQNVGKDMSDFLMYQKQKNDSLAVTDAMNQLSDRTNKILSDPQTGLLNRRGKDALSVPQAFADQYEQAASDITSKLTNLSQRAAFGAMAASERRYSQMRIDQHVSSEMQQFQNQTYTTAVANATSRAIQSNGDATIIAGSLSQIGALVRNQATVEGWSEDMTQYMLTKAQSGVHEGVIDNLLTAGNYKQAQSYFDATKTDIDGQTQDKIQQELKIGLVRSEATLQAQKIISGNPNDLASQLKAADAIDDPNIHDEVVRQISQHDELMQRAKDDQHKNALSFANDAIANGKPFNSLPPSVVSQFTPSEAEGYRKYANYLASGAEPPQNWGKWTDFMAKVGENPAAIAKMNLMTDVRPYVDNAHYNQAVEMQKAAIEASGGDKTKLTALMDPIQRFDNTVFPVAFPSQKSPSELTGSDRVRYGKLMSEVQGEISQQETQLGRKLTPTEMQKTMDDFVHEQVFVHGRFYGSDQVSRAAITQDQEGRAFIPIAQIPQARIGGIDNLITSMGGKPSDDKRERIYAAAVLGDDDAIVQIAKEQ